MIFMDLDGIWEMSVKSLEATHAMFKLTILTFVAIFVTISSALASSYINCMDIHDVAQIETHPE